MDKQLSKLVCYGIVASSLLLLFRRTNYLLNFLSLAIKITFNAFIGGEGAMVVAFSAFLFPREEHLGWRLPQACPFDGPKMRDSTFANFLVASIFLQQSILDSLELEDRCIFDLINLNAIAIFSQLKQCILFIYIITLTIFRFTRA